jgi:hypothetical protein
MWEAIGGVLSAIIISIVGPIVRERFSAKKVQAVDTSKIFYIIAKHSGKGLDVEGGQKHDGVKV